MSVEKLYGQPTPQERRVMTLVLAGAGPTVIAEEMGISQNTVKTYLRRLDCKVPGQKPIRLRIHLWAHGVPFQHL